jgi:hypothetical protein
LKETKHYHVDIVTHLLKPLQGNGSVNMFQHATMGAVLSIARQQPARKWTG